MPDCPCSAAPALRIEKTNRTLAHDNLALTWLLQGSTLHKLKVTQCVLMATEYLLEKGGT